MFHLWSWEPGVLRRPPKGAKQRPWIPPSDTLLKSRGLVRLLGANLFDDIEGTVMLTEFMAHGDVDVYMHKQRDTAKGRRFFSGKARSSIWSLFGALDSGHLFCSFRILSGRKDMSGNLGWRDLASFLSAKGRHRRDMSGHQPEPYSN